MLDATDIQILLIIQKDPLTTLSQITNQINLSVSNVSKRIDKLKNKYKIFMGVPVDLNLDALDLEIHDFFFNVEKKKSLQVLEEKFCHYHPYLLFRNRCTGKTNGLYMQFRIPKGGLNYLEELADILTSKEIISGYEYINRNLKYHSLRVKSALNYWNPEEKRWIFDWDTWKKGFHETSLAFSETKIDNKSILGQLSELDIKILAELSLDARQQNVEIIKKLGLKDEPGIPQKISRSVRFLKEHAITDYRAFLHWSSFDLYQSIIIKGQCTEEVALKIRNYLLYGNQRSKATDSNNSIYFPFQSLYYITNSGFLWYVRAPPSHLSEFIDFIWDICPTYELYFLDYRYSQIYGLWAHTFDADHRSWKLNHDLMIDSVLEKIL